jgi:ATP/maltotriose-dependent transcriptional regulator MalT
MAAAIFHAKLAIPSLPSHFLSRPRLNAVWDQPDCRLVTVTAGAGWGKTDFLSERAQDLSPRVLWYTLDDLDRDPTVLVAHLAAACGLPPSSAPPLEQLAGIVTHLDGCRLLVLDDVHAISRARAARDLLSRLIRYLPGGCVLALGSREPIDLPVARLDGRGQTARLTAEDLALAPTETEAALQGRLGPDLAGELVHRIQALTEGWPIGLEICCQALSDTPPEQAGEVLTRLEEGQGQWFEMFSAEVLADLDPDLRSFLLDTSVLPHLDADLCDDLLERKDSARLLQSLAASGLFLAAVGEESWRTHNLMRRCLRRHLDREATPIRRRKLGRRAARLLAARGEPEAAALDLVRSGDADGAAALLARHAHPLAETSRPETLALVLEGLPSGMVEASAPLLLIRAGLSHLRGDWDAAEADLKRGLRRQPSARVTVALRAHLVRVHLRRGHFSRCLSAGKRTLAGSPRPTGSDRGLILASLGVAAASLGRLDQGLDHLIQARKLARRTGDHLLEGRCHFLIAANIHYVRGIWNRPWKRPAGRGIFSVNPDGRTWPATRPVCSVSCWPAADGRAMPGKPPSGPCRGRNPSATGSLPGTPA